MATQDNRQDSVAERQNRARSSSIRRLGGGLLILAALLLVVGGTIAARTSSAEAGRTLVEIPAVGTTIEFPEGTQTDLGMVEPGEKYTHRFAVRNLGPGEFRYADFDWGCRPCAHMDIVLEPDPLSPGQTGNLILSSQVRPLLQGAEVRTFPVLLASNRMVKVFQLSVAQETPWEPTIELSVPELRFGDMWMKGDPKVMETKVRLDIPPAIRSDPLVVETDNPSVSGVLKAEQSSERELQAAPIREFLLTVKVDPQRLPLGGFRAALTVRAPFGSSQLKVSGEIVEGLAVHPDPLLIKKPRDARPAVGYVVLRNLTDNELILEEVASDTPGIECEDLSPHDNTVKRLQVKVAEPGTFSGNARIELKCSLGGNRHVLLITVHSW